MSLACVRWASARVDAASGKRQAARRVRRPVNALPSRGASLTLAPMSLGGALIELQARVERKRPLLCAYVEVPASAVAGWRLTETTVVDGFIDDTALGRRTIKRWDERRWFVELPKALLQRAGIDIGQRVRLRLAPADESPPAEIAALLAADGDAAAAWAALSPALRRSMAETVRSAAAAATRERRARAAIGRARAATACRRDQSSP
jgi:Bacteriocin-protection, YdeI or OmpD-Associated